MNDVGIHNEGVIAVEDSGPHPAPPDDYFTFILLPGFGDLRQTYRYLGPLLHESGHRVLVADLRGHGESSSGFPSYNFLDVAGDILSIIKYFDLKSNVVLVGNASSGSPIMKVAAMEPNTVKAIVGLAPVCRDMIQDVLFKPMTYVLFFWMWGVSTWLKYFKSQFKKRIPEDENEYISYLGSILREYGRLWAVAEMSRSAKKPCFEFAKYVVCPVLLIYGEKDPEFSNSLEEAHEVVKCLTSTRTKYEVIIGVGHYPQVEEPLEVHEMITTFLKDV